MIEFENTFVISNKQTGVVKKFYNHFSVLRNCVPIVNFRQLNVKVLKRNQKCFLLYRGAKYSNPKISVVQVNIFNKEAEKKRKRNLFMVFLCYFIDYFYSG
jgi:hypothetical protein